METKNITVKIKTVRESVEEFADLSLFNDELDELFTVTDIADDVEDEADILAETEDGDTDIVSDSDENEDEREELEVICRGTMSIDGTSVRLDYRDDELYGFDGSNCAVAFDTREPHVVSMLRDGISSVTLVFEEGRRHISTYTIPFVDPLQVCVYSYSVKNRLLEDGHIELEYYVEIQGGVVERSSVEISIS